MIPYLKSITPISRFFDTQSRPVVVMCNDFSDYICKYGKPHDLFNEYLSARFCELWGLRTAPFAFVTIEPEHVIAGFQKRLFERPCFGSKYLEFAQDLTHFFFTKADQRYEISRIINKDDFIKIGLFDLWLCNEDRHHNHSNLLIAPEHDGNYFVAIDHVSIFNTNNLDKEVLCHLCEEETLLTSGYINVLWKKPEHLVGAIESLEMDFMGYVESCRQALPDILSEVPKEWGIDLEQKRAQMEKLFLADWLQATIGLLRPYLARAF